MNAFESVLFIIVVVLAFWAGLCIGEERGAKDE